MVAMESRWLSCGLWILCFIILMTSSTCVIAKEKRQTRAVVEVDNPDEAISVLSNLVQNLLQASSMEHDKRNLDLGFSRGFSGSQAAKHLMGLAAANFAGGPGRRKRSEE